MTDYAELAQKLKPYIVPWLTGGGGSAPASAAGGAHALSGPQHTGLLAQGQAPWAATAAALNAHIANPNAHHARLHNIISAADHQLVGSRWSVLGATADDTLGLLVAAYDVSSGLSRLLRSEGGDLALRILGATTVNATNVNGGTVIGSTRLRSPILDTASGGLTVSPAAGLDLDPASSLIRIMSAVNLRSENYASQTTGWAVDYNGAADFRYLFTDELHAKAFIADLEQALAGLQIITKSVAVLAVNFTVPAPTATATIRLKDLPSAPNMACFQSGDLIRLRTFSRSGGSLTIGDAWGVVTSYADQSDGTQTWTFTRSAIPNHGALSTGTVIAADAIVLDYGIPGAGNGYYEVNAVDGLYGANAPYAQVAVWGTHPVADLDVRVRVGNLKGITGATEYGLWAGRASGGNVKVTSDGVMLRQGTTPVIALYDDGTSRFESRMTIGPNGEIVQGDPLTTPGAQGNWTGAWGTFTGLRMGRDAGVGRIGGYNAGVLQWSAATDGTLRFGNRSTYNADYTGILSEDGVTVFAGPDETGWRNGYRGKIDAQLMGGLYFIKDYVVKPSPIPPLFPPHPFIYTLLEARPVTLPYGWWGDSATYAARLQLMAVGNATYPGTVGVFARGAADTGIYVSAYAQTITAHIADIAQLEIGANLLALLGSAPTLNVGSANLTTGTASVQVGHARTGNGYALLDLVGDATYTDYGMRIIRGNAGANAVSQILHRGTGNFVLQAQEAAAMLFQTNSLTRGTFKATGELDLTEPLQREGVTGYIFIPVIPFEMTDTAANLWNGGASLTTGSRHFDLNDAANGSLPADAKAVAIYLSGQWSAVATGNFCAAKQYGAVDSDSSLQIRSYVANYSGDIQGIVALDSGCRFTVTIYGATMNNSLVRCIGYYM